MPSSGAALKLMAKTSFEFGTSLETSINRISLWEGDKKISEVEGSADR
jgi:hypothetical protein